MQHGRLDVNDYYSEMVFEVIQDWSQPWPSEKSWNESKITNLFHNWYLEVKKWASIAVLLVNDVSNDHNLANMCWKLPFFIWQTHRGWEFCLWRIWVPPKVFIAYPKSAMICTPKSDTICLEGIKIIALTKYKTILLCPSSHQSKVLCTFSINIHHQINITVVIWLIIGNNLMLLFLATVVNEYYISQTKHYYKDLKSSWVNVETCLCLWYQKPTNKEDMGIFITGFSVNQER